MKKIYLEIGSSVGAILAFILLIVIVNHPSYGLHELAVYANVAILVIFVITVGIFGIKLAEIND